MIRDAVVGREKAERKRSTRSTDRSKLIVNTPRRSKRSVLGLPTYLPTYLPSGFNPSGLNPFGASRARDRFAEMRTAPLRRSGRYRWP